MGSPGIGGTYVLRPHPASNRHHVDAVGGAPCHRDRRLRHTPDPGRSRKHLRQPILLRCKRSHGREHPPPDTRFSAEGHYRRSATFLMLLNDAAHACRGPTTSCRDATKIDKTRLATLTKFRRVAEACQSRLHNAWSRHKTDLSSSRRSPTSPTITQCRHASPTTRSPPGVCASPTAHRRRQVVHRLAGVPVICESLYNMALCQFSSTTMRVVRK